MGRILLEAMVEGNAISPKGICIYNRTPQKALDLKREYPELTVASHFIDIAKDASLIFLCVKPHDILAVSKEIASYISTDQCVVSITSPISPKQLESILPCSVVRIIPSITNRALSGVSLITTGDRCKKEWEDKLYSILESFSTPIQIDDAITRVASDIVSCGPAFFSFLTQRFIDGAVEETKIDEETATKLASEMLIGLGELLKKGYYTLPTLQQKVCVKGGITGEGINVMEQELGYIFNHLFQATHSKYNEEKMTLQKKLSKT